MVSIYTTMILMIVAIITMVNSRMIPHRDHRYILQNDCDLFKKAEDKISEINEAQDCFDYSPESGFQCCYVDLKSDPVNGSNPSKAGPFCMIVHSGNTTDLNELKTFVSTQGLYGTVTCSAKYITMSSLIALLLFLA